MQLYENIIKEVQESPKGAKGAKIGAFFDFDGTIIYGYSATKYLREQIRRGDVKPRHIPKVARVMTQYALGDLDFSGMMADTSEFLKGINEQDYIEFGELLYKKHLAKLIYPESRALIEAHLKQGHTVALISAATPYQVTPAARELGIKHVMCTRLGVANGKFTGKVIRPTCYGMGKVAAAEQLAEKHKLDPQQSYFYSDSDEDIELLEWVGKPRPLNPNSRLRRIARGRGWPVRDFNSRGRIGVVDYARTFAAQASMVTSFLAGLPIAILTGSQQAGRNFSTSLFADTACAIAGIELDVAGQEHLWSSRPCVFVFNHQSQADVVIMAALVRRDMAGVGKKEIGDVPVLGKIMQYGGTVLIDRENSESAVQAMSPLVDAMLKEGRCVCIAPEGTRSTSTNLGRFKKGAFHLAMQAGVPMVPIVIHNAIDVAPSTEFVFRPATVKVTVLPPVDTSHWTIETIDQHITEVRDSFLIELDQMKYQQPDSQRQNSREPVAQIKEKKTKPGSARPNARLTKPLAPKAKKTKSTPKPTLANAKNKALKTNASKANDARLATKRRAKKRQPVKISAKAVNGQIPQQTGKPVRRKHKAAAKPTGEKAGTRSKKTSSPRASKPRPSRKSSARIVSN